MKKMLSSLSVVVVGGLLLCLIWYAIGILAGPPRYWLYEIKQQGLAKELGVSIDDYSTSGIFPVGYFSAVLKRGMSIEQVHAIVRGYSRVLHCGYREVYYYYIDKDPWALRFAADYDVTNQDMFVGLVLDDPGSAPLTIEGCQPGPLSP